MKKLLACVVPLAMAAVIGAGPAFAAEHANETPEYPIKHLKEVDWSFAGPFGTFDKGQLQRGLKIYVETCSACHSINLVPFRSFEALGYSEDQVKSLAANYEIQDGPNADGDMFTRAAIPADYFPPSFANPEAAAASNNGAVPPDFSLLAKARYVPRGFPQFIFDIFTGYAESGPNYIYSLLTGYEEPPAGVEVPENAHYNPYFMGGAALAMASPLSDGQITYDDGSPETVDQYARDVAAFMMWAAEPHMVERKKTGFMVISFLLIFSALMYLTKKAVYANRDH